VVVGGGFAGAQTAKQLDANPRAHVVLVDTKPFFESTPEVLRTFVETNIQSSVALAQKISVSHADIVQRGKVIEGKLVEILPEAKKVVLDGDTLSYDYLVLATGTSYRSNIKQAYIPKKERSSPNFSMQKRRSELLGDTATKIQISKHVLIVGGGVVGVELAGEIICQYPDKKVTLVHRQPRLIDKMSSKVSNYCHKFLSSRKVRLWSYLDFI